MVKKRRAVKAAMSNEKFYTTAFPNVKVGEVKVAPQRGNYTVFIGLSDGTIAYQWCESKVKAMREAKYARDTVKRYGSDAPYWTAEGYKIYNPKANASASIKQRSTVKASKNFTVKASASAKRRAVKAATSEKRWLSTELPKDMAWNFKVWLRDNGIKFEPSEAGNLIHFEVFMDRDEAQRANDFIDSIDNGVSASAAPKRRRAIRAGYTPKKNVLWLFNADENQWVPCGTWSKDTVTEEEMYELSHRRFPNAEYNADYNYTDYMLLPNDGSQPDDGRPVRASAAPKRKFTVKASCGGKKPVKADYRRYEDPYKLEQMLEEAEARLAEDPDDVDLCIWVQELRDRINFAWQDDEYDAEYADRFDDDVFGKSNVTCTEKTDTFVIYNHGNFVSSGGYDALRGGLYEIVSVDEDAKKACIDYCNSFGDPVIEETATAQEVADTTTEVIAAEYSDAWDAEEFAVYIGDHHNGVNIEIFDKALAAVNAAYKPIADDMANKREDYSGEYVIVHNGNVIITTDGSSIAGKAAGYEEIYDIIKNDPEAVSAIVDYLNQFDYYFDEVIGEDKKDDPSEVADALAGFIESEYYEGQSDPGYFGSYVSWNGNVIEWFDAADKADDVNAATDVEIEKAWNDFADVPMNPETEEIEQDFMHFPAGTNREEIWRWFDKNHSKGVAHLLYGKEDIKCGYDLGADTADDTYTVDSFFGYNGDPFRGLADGITTDDWSEVESWSHEHLLKGENVKIDGPQGVLEITADEYNQAWEDGAADFDINEQIVDYKQRIVNSSTNITAASRSGEVDPEAVRELVLVITNDGDLYRERTTPMIENLKKKVSKGVYDREKAVKLWQYLADEGVRRYGKEYGPGYSVAWLSPATRRAIAEQLRDYYEEEIMWDVNHPADANASTEITTI